MMNPFSGIASGAKSLVPGGNGSSHGGGISAIKRRIGQPNAFAPAQPDPMLAVMDAEIAKAPSPEPMKVDAPDLKTPDVGDQKVTGGPAEPPDLSNEPRTNLKPETPAGPDRSKWNTDGYAGPATFTERKGSALGGYDPTKWANQEHQTPKYAIGGILSQFDPKGGLNDDVVAAIAAAYPGTQRIGNDKIDIPGVGITDVLNSADAGGSHWQWLDPNGGGGAAAQSSNPFAGLDAAGRPMQLAEMDENRRIEEYLRAIMQGNSQSFGGM